MLGHRCVRDEKRVRGVYDKKTVVVTELLLLMTWVGSLDETFIWRCNRVVVSEPFLRTPR